MHAGLFALGIIALSFVSEDAATISSSLLVLGGPIAWPFGFVSCFLGIWLGDIGLYSAARWIGKPVLESRWLKKAIDPVAIAGLQKAFVRRGTFTLFASRFVPGTRLPTYLAAGLFSMPATRFMLITAIAAFIWISAFFGLAKLLGAQTLIWFSSFQSRIAPVGITIVCLGVALFAFRRLPPLVRRWEFWPAWLFYLPVGLYYIWLGLRYRSFSLTSAANPGIPTGGLIGESKCAILDQLRRVHSEFVADAYLLEGATVTDRLLSLHRICRANAINLPFILKPDFGQRGSGVKLIRTMRDALNYLEQVDSPVIAQRYASGPHEVGIFYYRFLDADRGRIFAITEKLFPSVTGDGVQTIEQLINSDPRARIIAKTYVRRFWRRRAEVLASDETLKLVETGNHAQGCIFRDGAHLWTSELEEAIDRISHIRGFYIGRYDIRYASEEELKRGQNFQIVELNGASAEATNIYDSRNSLRSAIELCSNNGASSLPSVLRIVRAVTLARRS